MSIRDKLKRRYPDLPYEEWHRKLRRDFWTLIISISCSWILAGLFTVWLLSR